uniref:B30.2/SPRY domain-containing protein n=1 Tax=Cyprinodon variegatus TaxID=28743 RepID=A0A3Q2FZV0_CYPVA
MIGACTAVGSKITSASVRQSLSPEQGHFLLLIAHESMCCIMLMKKMATLSEAITKTREELRADDLLFLRRRGAAAERVRQQTQMDRPPLLSGLLLDKAKHKGNLTFNIWSKMNDLYFPVILDPNTAHPGLRLTKHLTGVKWGESQELPDNPERFDSSSIILGSEGFTSGIHSWEVEVGENQHWMLGVAPESSKRKGPLGQRSGLWTLAYYKGTYKAFSPSRSVFDPPVKKKLQKIRVHMNCDAGVLRFFDPEALIQSFRCSSTEPLFPFLGTTDGHFLKIQPDTVCVLNNFSDMPHKP